MIVITTTRVCYQCKPEPEIGFFLSVFLESAGPVVSTTVVSKSYCCCRELTSCFRMGNGWTWPGLVVAVGRAENAFCPNTHLNSQTEIHHTLQKKIRVAGDYNVNCKDQDSLIYLLFLMSQCTLQSLLCVSSSWTWCLQWDLCLTRNHPVFQFKVVKKCPGAACTLDRHRKTSCKVITREM